MNLWLILIAGGLLTYLIRLSFIAVFGKVAVPPLLQRSLRYVPPAVLSAIIFPDLLLGTGELNFTLENQRLWAGLLAALVAWRTRNALLTIAAGLAALWLMQWLFTG